jgi:hypothetical protein
MSVRKRTWTTLGGGVAFALTVAAAGAAEATVDQNSVRFMEATVDQNSVRFIMPGCRDFLFPADLPNITSLVSRAHCMGAVSGIVFMGKPLAVTSPSDSLDGAIRRYLCLNIPFDVTLSDEITIVIAYAESRPERANGSISFYALALEALRAAWPCK